MSETVIFNPLKFQRQQAVATIRGCAESCRLHVESIREKSKLLSIEMRVRVTGDPKQVESFASTAGGRQEQESRRARLRRLLGGIWMGVERSNW